MKKTIILVIFSIFLVSCKNSDAQNSDKSNKITTKTNEKTELNQQTNSTDTKKISQPNFNNKIDQDSVLDLMNSAKTGDIYKVDKYIKAGKMSVNSKDINGRTPLMSASFGNQVKVIKYLLENGADLTIKDVHNGTPLLWAINGKAYEAIEMLLEKGSSPDELLKGNQSAIMLSAVIPDEKIFDLLAKKGVKNINQKDSDGRNLLHWAVFGKNQAIVKKVLELKVSKTEKDNYGKTAIDYAKEMKLTEIEKLLEK
ncbi:ankyrin repeat domain-containing protein [bacterium]|nr:ankyrin repeat domain-containing protein [bacterium]